MLDPPKMFKLNLKIALRNLWKNKGYTLINVFGLAIGIASCILIFIFIQFQLNFDKDYKNSDRIYRIVTNWRYNSFDDYSQGVPVPVAAAVRNEISGVEKVAPIARDGGVIIVKDSTGKELQKIEKSVFYTEPSFFEIFETVWIKGSFAALAEPNTVVLSEETAKIFFGSAANAIGKNINHGNRLNLKVVGVFKDQPENSNFPLEIVISYQSFYGKDYADWDSVSSQWQCYVLLKGGIQLADLEQPLAKFNQKYYKDKKVSGNQINALQALNDVHFNERYGNFANSTITKKEIYGLAIIALFLILTACINFINLATAQAVNRAKEVGVRKVMGGRRRQLMLQFLTETLVITLMALLIGCALSELALPTMQNLFKVKAAFSLFNGFHIFLFIGLLAIMVSFLAGVYPAMIMSGFSPALAIKNKVKVSTNGLSLRKLLVVTQFAITIVLIISTLFIIKQMEYVRDKPLGFNAQAIAMIGAPRDSISKIKRNSFKARILQIPGVKAMSYCSRPPLSDELNTTSFYLNGQENKDFEVRVTPADEQYFNLFDLKLIAGKIFKKSDTINGYVVNETFLKKIHILDPQKAIGQMLNPNRKNAPIVGVIQDFNDQSLKEQILPMIIYPENRSYYRAAVKIDNRRILSVMKEVEALWKLTFPNEVYSASFLDDSITNYYQTEHLMGVLFKVFAGVIIFISFIGLFGLISFVARQRTKEMAIRKVLGATSFELVKMLNSSFLMMVLLANVVAWPLAYLFVSNWLSTFAYRMDLSIWPFLLAMFITMLITLITVSIRSYKAATANAVDALKYE